MSPPIRVAADGPPWAVPPAPLKLAPHPLRGAVLGEVHARPFRPLATPCRVLHFAFLTSPAESAAAREALAHFCEERGLSPPRPGAKHHRIVLADGALRWESHGEFATYSWEVSGADRSAFERPAALLAGGMAQLPQPGPHLVSVDLHLMPRSALGEDPVPVLYDIFDEASLAGSEIVARSALVATDFQVGSDGFVRILLCNAGMDEVRTGATVQRVLELETYRCLALLGLPEAQRLGPSVRRIEESLADITRSMTQTEGLASNNALLHRLTALASELEADAAASLYRFGATRAYDGILNGRLTVLEENPIPGLPTIASFLSRRISPALRTCLAIEERQANLSSKLARAAQLLRTRVDIELQEQNRDLLSAMNERTRLQLRLSQTVEGLSIAAISYYIVSLIGAFFKGASEAGAPVNPGLAMAISVPLSIVFVAWTVRRIRKAFGDH